MADQKIELTKFYNAPPEKVYEQWKDNEIMKKWWAPDDDWAVPEMNFPCATGENFEIGLENPNGDTYGASGKYEEVIDNEKMVFSWRWKTWPGDRPDSKVVVSLEAKDGGTELKLMHEGLSDESFKDHEEGWKNCLDRMEKLLK